MRQTIETDPKPTPMGADGCNPLTRAANAPSVTGSSAPAAEEVRSHPSRHLGLLQKIPYRRWETHSQQTSLPEQPQALRAEVLDQFGRRIKGGREYFTERGSGQRTEPTMAEPHHGASRVLSTQRR